MNRKRRTTILIRGARCLSRKMSQHIQSQYELQELQPPKGTLIMLKSREHGKGTLFYLGELYATETKIMIQDQIGLGIVSGHDEALSRDLAIIDAAYKAGVNLVDFEKDLLDQEQKILIQDEQQFFRLQETAVDFSTMETSDVS